MQSTHITWRQLPALKDNYIYLLVDEVAHKVAAIDPGESPQVKEFLTSQSYDLNAIFITHHHDDHVGGVANLLADYACPVYAPKYDMDKGLLPKVFSQKTEWVKSVKGGDGLWWQGLHIAVLDLPGHTLGHVGFLADAINQQHWLFAGDVLFAMGCGYLFSGDYELAWQSLQKIKNLPMDTLLFMGHECGAVNGNFARQFFAATQQKKNDRLEARIAALTGVRGGPVALELELATNPFLQTTDVANFRQWREYKNISAG